MELRNHPLMRYYGLPVWPPRWSPTEQPSNKILRGEMGILKRVSYSSMAGYACHLYMEYEGRKYVGTVLIDDAAFCWQLYFVLQRQAERSLEQIGSLDLSYTL
jgi:hypothetical protein